MINVTTQLVEPLLRSDLVESETLVNQFEFAVTVSRSIAKENLADVTVGA